MPEWDAEAQRALDRMKRAHARGFGCYLTAEMVQNLGLTSIGEIWSQPNPHKPQKEKKKQ
jgi:hypothetical protein